MAAFPHNELMKKLFLYQEVVIIRDVENEENPKITEVKQVFSRWIDTLVIQVKNWVKTPNLYPATIRGAKLLCVKHSKRSLVSTKRPQPIHNPQANLSI